MSGIVNWIKGYKTLGFGMLLTILGQLQQSNIWATLPPQYAGLGLSILGLLVMILRMMTTTPMGSDLPQVTPQQIVEGAQKVIADARVVAVGTAEGVVKEVKAMEQEVKREGIRNEIDPVKQPGAGVVGVNISGQ